MQTRMKTLLVHLKAKTRRAAGLAVTGALIGITFAGSSCVRKSLYTIPQEGVISFEVNWNDLATGDQAPTEASLYIYNEDGTLERNVPFSAGKYRGNIAPGVYRALVVSDGREGVHFTSMDNYTTAAIRALEATKVSKAVELPDGVTELQRMEWTYGCKEVDIEVGVGDTLRRTVEPGQLPQHVKLNFTVAGDRDAVESVEAVLTGVAQHKNLSTMDPSDGYASAVPLSLEEAKAAGQYQASALVLGVDNKHPDGTHVPNDVIIRVAFDNGGGQTIDQDITDEIKQAIENGGGGGTGGLDIEVDVEVEVSKNSTGEYTATVTKWVVTTGGVIVQKQN